MELPRRYGPWARASLACAVAVPLLYFAAQVTAQLGTPGYDWTRQLASELGSAGAPAAALFNIGMVATGVATIVAAPGYKVALDAIARSGVLSWLTALSLVSSGAATLWAGLNPLPDPAHNPGLWGLGTILFPLLLLLSLARVRGAGRMRVYLIITVALEAAFLLVSMGLLPIGVSIPAGLLQRVGAVLVYVPVAVGGIFLLRRV